MFGLFSKTLRRNRFHRPFAQLCPELLEDRLVLTTVQPGFVETIVVNSLSSATAMEFAPDGKLYVTESAGTIEVWQNGTRLEANFFANQPFVRYSATTDLGLVDNRGERGMLGIAFDPNFAVNRYVYVYYTYAVNADGNTGTPTSFRNRVSRFTADTSGNRAVAGSEQVILELNNLTTATNHNGGAIHFGADGKLYVAVGDNATGANAQSMSTRHGKMLRINADGSIPTDNPFYNTATGDNRAIWALGLRNPFTFAFQPGSSTGPDDPGRMFINDVGQSAWEEINIGAPGANYGWSTTEGDFNPATFPNFTRPFYAYSHNPAAPVNGFAITGAAFYNPSNPTIVRFPTSYDGDFFFADYVSDWIKVIDTTTMEVTAFVETANGVVDLRVGGDGSLFYLARDQSRVVRVTYTGNQTPSIGDPPQNQTASEGTAATFTVGASGTGPLSYQWQRAENGTSDWQVIGGATASTYQLANAQLSDNGDLFRVIVTNAFGSATSTAAVLTVTQNQPPVASITIDAGLTGGKFIAGQAVAFSGSATDPEGGTPGAASFTWRIDFISSIDSGSPIERPFVPEFDGQTSGQFTPAVTGPYLLVDVAYRITLTVIDSLGLSTTVTRDVFPNTATVTIATDPSGLEVNVDGQPFAAGHSFVGVVGFERPIGVSTSQTLGGTTYAFVSWSDGGTATHVIVTPAVDTTYTARFNSAPQILGVYARGTGSGSANWGASFLAYLASNNLGDASLGYRLSNGAGQLTTVPWRNVNTISIQFSEGVTVAQGDLTVVRSSNGAAVPAVSGFAWNASTNVATWTFAAALPLNKYLLHLGSAVIDVDGAVLDGEWTVSSSTVSGNGAAGGDFNFRFNVLPADTDANQTISNGEALQRRLHTSETTATGGYVYREDMDGGGTITVGYALQTRLLTSSTLTGLNEPIVPGGSPQAIDALPDWITAISEEHVSPFAALTHDELTSLVGEAIARWVSSGLVPAGARPWSDLRFTIADLGGYLGLTGPDGLVQIDDDGAGWGWFIDTTPASDEEFAATADVVELIANDAGPAAGRVDLLTTLMHEIGNFLGYQDVSIDDPPAVLMTEVFTTGLRRIPAPVAVAAIIATSPDEVVASEVPVIEASVIEIIPEPQAFTLPPPVAPPLAVPLAASVFAVSTFDASPSGQTALRAEHAALALWATTPLSVADKPISSNDVTTITLSYVDFDERTSGAKLRRAQADELFAGWSDVAELD